MFHPSNIVVAIVVFIVGAWAASKWPQVNLIGKLTGQ